MLITPQMKMIAKNHPVGMVATVNADGTPNVSPKGTMEVLDDHTLMFAEIASPTTLANLKERPAIEINFLDVLTRKCFRAKGTAEVVSKDSPSFDALFAHFEKWGDLANRVRHIIKVHVVKASVISSPIYDHGKTEESLKTHYIDHFQKLAKSQ